MKVQITAILAGKMTMEKVEQKERKDQDESFILCGLGESSSHIASNFIIQTWNMSHSDEEVTQDRNPSQATHESINNWNGGSNFVHVNCRLVIAEKQDLFSTAVLTPGETCNNNL